LRIRANIYNNSKWWHDDSFFHWIENRRNRRGERNESGNAMKKRIIISTMEAVTMKRRWIVILLAVLLAGCEQTGVSEDVRSGGERKSAASPAVALPDETGSAPSAELERLKEEIRRLKRELERHETEKSGLDPERHPEVYRRIDRFR